jgi:hypothetical protein
MAVLSVVEQALMTGSPLPERLPTPLVRHFYESWHEQRQNVILTKSLIRDEDYRRFCVAVSSYLKFLSVVDDLVLLLKRASGECHILHRWEDV